MDDIIQNFQFAVPVWLWGLIVLPVVWTLYVLFYRKRQEDTKLENFADPHLLPHLLGEDEGDGKKKDRAWPALLSWSFLWVCGFLAMAGPRWDYTEVKAFAPARNLVIILDLSKSMDAEDIKPSRLGRARQEIEDINKQAEGMNIGLIAFASVPHVITPLTDNRETLRRLLPSLKTDLVYTQGSNLSPALQRAKIMLSSELGEEKHILVISDGGFQDGDAQILRTEKELTKQGIRIHVMGMGTLEGAPVPDSKGSFIKDNGKTVISRLEKERLQRIAQDGKGVYLETSYLENDTRNLLARVNKATENEMRKTTIFWEERFYLFLMPLILFLLPWFRRNAAFPAVFLVCLILQSGYAQAFEWRELFLNKEQQGKMAVEKQEYEEAVQKFDDPYRRGVAQYKAGQYEEASKSFQAARRQEIKLDSRYNTGNAQLMNGEIEEAIDTYENILKKNPDHESAKHNLEIAKKLLEQQQQQQGDKEDNQDQQNQNEEDSPQENNDQSDSSDQQSEEQDEDKDSQSEENEKDQSEEEQSQEEKQQKAERTQKDIDADQWLSRIQNDQEMFLKNKFYIESQRQGAKEGASPW